MPDMPCPKCGTSTSKTLDSINEYADVKYYRCACCGHVWVTPKFDGTVAYPITIDVLDWPSPAIVQTKRREKA